MVSESKREKFVRLAESRVNTILKQLSLISNLSNKSNYDYTKEDIDKIIKTLRKSINELELKFSSKNKSDFKL